MISKMPINIDSLQTFLFSLHYPIDCHWAAMRAKQQNESEPVVDFFQSLPSDTRFGDESQVLEVAIELNTLESELAEQPHSESLFPEELEED